MLPEIVGLLIVLGILALLWILAIGFSKAAVTQCRRWSHHRQLRSSDPPTSESIGILASHIHRDIKFIRVRVVNSHFIAKAAWALILDPEQRLHLAKAALPDN
jgi:hypothetical protein